MYKRQHTHWPCSRKWVLILVAAEILWEEEGFQFGFKRWQGWRVSKVLWEWIPNTYKKIEYLLGRQRWKSHHRLIVSALLKTKLGEIKVTVKKRGKSYNWFVSQKILLTDMADPLTLMLRIAHAKHCRDTVLISCPPNLYGFHFRWLFSWLHCSIAIL